MSKKMVTQSTFHVAETFCFPQKPRCRYAKTYRTVVNLAILSIAGLGKRAKDNQGPQAPRQTPSCYSTLKLLDMSGALLVS